MSRTFDVIDGKLRLTDSGVRIWYTAEHLRRIVSSMEVDFAEWRRRLAMLEAPTAPQAEDAITETVPTPPSQ